MSGYVTSHGYRRIYHPDHPARSKNGEVYEHRIVAERKIGRYLREGEVVHHVNGDRLDNRPENLEIFVSNGEHLKHELPLFTPGELRQLLLLGHSTTDLCGIPSKSIAKARRALGLPKHMRASTREKRLDQIREALRGVPLRKGIA